MPTAIIIGAVLGIARIGVPWYVFWLLPAAAILILIAVGYVGFSSKVLLKMSYLQQQTNYLKRNLDLDEAYSKTGSPSSDEGGEPDTNAIRRLKCGELGNVVVR
jgi:hypothetical protein